MADLIAELEGVVRLIRKGDEWNGTSAAYTFLRTHHAEVAAAVRDKRRLDWLESEANTRGGLLLHDGSESGRRGLGLGFRDLRTAIDSAMRAGEGEG